MFGEWYDAAANAAPEQWGTGMMVRTFWIAGGIGLSLLIGINSAQALGPVSTIGASAGAQIQLEASFFGRPYPYGYTGWGPCVRYVEVEGRMGPRLRRIWVCR